MAQARVNQAVIDAYWARKAPNLLTHPKQYSASSKGGSIKQFMTALAKKVGVWCHDCNHVYCDCTCSGAGHAE